MWRNLWTGPFPHQMQVDRFAPVFYILSKDVYIISRIWNKIYLKNTYTIHIELELERIQPRKNSTPTHINWKWCCVHKLLIKFRIIVLKNIFLSLHRCHRRCHTPYKRIPYRYVNKAENSSVHYAELAVKLNLLVLDLLVCTVFILFLFGFGLLFDFLYLNDILYLL